MEYELKNKRITCFVKKPAGYRYEGLVEEETQFFLIIRNDRLNKINYISKDNVASLEVLS